MEDLNVMGSVYGNSQDLGSYDGFNYSPQPKESLLVRATKKYTASKAASEEEKRRADAASLGTIASDIQARQIAERQKFDTLEASIARTQAMLEGPPPAQTPQLGTADYAAMLLQAVAGGGNQLGQSYQNLMGMRGQETQVANQNAQDAWRFQTGRTQDEIENLRRLQGQALEGAQYYERAGLNNQISQLSQEADNAKFQAELDLKDRSLQQKGTLGQQANTLKAAAGPYRAWSNPNLSAEDRNKAGALFTQITGQHPGQIDAESASWLLKESQAKQTDAKTEGIGLDNEFKQKSMPDRLAKVKADVQNTLASTRLKGAQLKQTLQKIEFYPLEFQARAANIYSQIEDRKFDNLNKTPEGKAVTLSNYDRLVKVLTQELGTIDAVSNPQAFLQATAEINRLNNERAKLVKERVYGVEPFRPDLPSGLANGVPAGPIPQAPVKPKKQNPASARGKTYKTKTGGKFEF